MADSIEEQLAWCERARVILAATSSKKKESVEKFDKQLNRVRMKLEELIKLAGEETPVVKEFVKDLDTIGRQALALKDPTQQGKKGQEELRKQAKEITSKLEALGNRIDASKPAKAIMDARKRFFDNCDRARKRLKELGSQDKSDTTEVQELLAFIENAEQTVRSDTLYQDPGECDKATQLIAGWLGRLALKLEQQAKGERQLDEAQSRAKPLVEEQTGIAERLLAEGLTTGQLTPELQTKLEETLKAVQLKGAGVLWTEALELCKQLPTASQCKKAYLLSKKQLKTGLKDQLGLCETALNQLGEVLDPAALEQERTRFNQLIAEGGGDLSETQVGLVRGKMVALVEAWNKRKNGQSEVKGQLAEKIRLLQLGVNLNAPMVPVPQRDENARQLELVTSLRDQRLFTDGLKVAETLERQVIAQKPAVESGQAWQQLAGSVVQLSADLGNWSKAQALPQQKRDDAERLSKTLSSENVGRLTAARDWATLIQAHGEGKAYLKSAGRASEKFVEYDPKRQPLRDDMNLEWVKVDKALSDFEQIARSAEVDPVPLLSKSVADLKALKADWEDWVKNTTRTSRTKIKTVKAAVAELLNRIKALDDPAKLKEVAGKQAESAAHGRFNTAKTAFINTQLAALLLVDALAGADFRKRLAELEKDDSTEEPGKPWAKRMAALVTLGEQATAAATQSGNKLQEQGRTQAQAVATQKERIAALRKTMDKKGLNVKTFGPLLDGLTKDVSNLELLTTTGNVTASNVNQRLLDELNARVEKLQMLVDHSSTFEDYTNGNDRYQESLDELKKDGLEKAAPETYTALKEQLAALKTDIYGMDPGPAGEAQRQMAIGLQAARVELDGIQEKQDRVGLDVAECGRRIRAFAKLGIAETYRKALEKRLSAARQLAETPTELAAALLEFKAIKEELTEVETNPDAAYQRQKTVLAEQQATLLLKREWQSRLSVIKGSVMSRLTSALQNGGDKSQKDEVQRIIDSAEKAVKDGKDYERGLRLLNQAEGRVIQIERNPEGTALGDRKALPKHVENYAANVVKLRQALEGFVAVAGAKVENPERKTRLEEVLTKMIEPLALQLNPGLFTTPLKTLMGDVPVEARREAREEALARLRNASTFINTHPTMVKLAANPVAPLQSDMRVLDASLTRLEAHLRASVR